MCNATGDVIGDMCVLTGNMCVMLLVMCVRLLVMCVMDIIAVTPFTLTYVDV